jgi:hypothetical protein
MRAVDCCEIALIEKNLFLLQMDMSQVLPEKQQVIVGERIQKKIALLSGQEARFTSAIEVRAMPATRSCGWRYPSGGLFAATLRAVALAAAAKPGPRDPSPLGIPAFRRSADLPAPFW